MRDSIIDLDKALLLSLNGSNSLFADGLIATLTNAQTWIPLYVALLYLVIKNNDSIKKIATIVACVVLCVLLAGTIDDLVVKPTVERWRPTHDPVIGTMVDVVNGYRGGYYGFFSAHAANTFSIALFFTLLVRNAYLSISLVTWSLANCWTRIYLGVHYPGDILVGLIWGATVATVVFFLYRYIIPTNNDATYITSQYSKTGYSATDSDVVISVLAYIFIYSLVKACIIFF